ncbi:phage head-tail adaptor, putative, SPP1 family [Mesorhizobium albiziae]|uniref:Phage head-tail adaptor, putative, SPP1 family n=1 Tax=Neomesorhizobium albiziae TaxID=335020 RepID=A0A1I4AK75_9HYPH|nr:phage head closure protein [Mesorhizobium albiziae]GLS32923.1 tail protein [Mesorhizobium albiziae]SFK56895.1 phage head-tail adaptor, putative, SPP1 family [Mesorhizobium albiziae]
MRSVLLDPGALRHELTLQAATPTADGLGGHAETWNEIASVFGLIEPVSANSIVRGDQALETVTHRITIRKRDGILSGMRFVKGTRVFAIVTIHDPDESGRYLVCRTREDGL